MRGGNLKKVLALVLSLSMALSLAVSAGAAFTDQNKIVNEEAVDMCVALNIINGFEDGSYRPTDNVTRGQAAKMICIALNGGKEPVLSASATPSYTDTANHWAGKYIEYCTSLGIVAGTGNGKFNPNGNVKGVELAKMLLIALGYNADTEKFVGKSWDTNVNVIASQKDLYKDLETIDPSVAASRDTAAQMIWNALNVDMVDYTYKLSTDANGNLVSEMKVYDLDKTLLGEKYGTSEKEGILTGFTYDDEKAEWTYTVDTKTFTTDADYTDLFQQNVKVIWKTVKGEVVVYGIFAEDSAVVAEGVLGDIDAADLADKSIEIAGVDYKTTGTSLKAYAFNAAADTKDITKEYVAQGNANGYSMKAIDNTGDDKIDVIVYLPFAIEKVTYVGASTITTATTGNVKVENINLVNTVAKNDYVMIVKDVNTVDGVAEYTKLDVLNGKVAATKAGDVQIDGTWYTPIASMELGTKYDFVAVNGYVYVATATSATVAADDYAVVVKYQSGADWNAEYPQAVLLFANGETKTVAYEMESANAAIPNEGALVQVVEVEDNVYTLTTSIDVIDDTTELAADADAYVKKDGKIGGYAINDNAVIFVRDTSDTPYEYKVITGADLKKLDNINASAVWNAMYLKDDATGYSSVVFAYVSTGMTTSSDLSYGYVVSDVTSTKDGTKTLSTFTVWNGSENVELTTNGTVSVSGLEKGVIVEYKLTDGKVSTLNIGATPAAVYAYNGKDISFTATLNDKMVITDETVIIYVDVADKAAVEGGSIQLAHVQNDGTTYVQNVAYIADTNPNSDGNYEVLMLVVDVDGHIDGTTVLN
ncbi:MAG: S-layer homology domain-containing protein [Ruminiclostridium sp.]|nr:S-layer homology domain-containing protein [Ruminiclostridium sp.]